MKRRDDLEGVNLLDLKPVRLADWEEKDNYVVLIRPAPASKGLRRALEAVTTWMSPHRVRLDEVGSTGWTLLDGTRTAGEIAATLRERFGESIEPAEERLGEFIRMLRFQGFVAYPGWDRISRTGKLRPGD
ncbi:MAG: PqqD family protein [Acidobacteria bacterium]|nr:PqqD family protein [Acidobacteriota bacterium]